MAGFVVFPKLSVYEAVTNILKAEKWFREHPTRKKAQTDLFKIRRGYVAEDVLKHSEWKP